jgi:hypothetical protein
MSVAAGTGQQFGCWMDVLALQIISVFIIQQALVVGITGWRGSMICCTTSEVQTEHLQSSQWQVMPCWSMPLDGPSSLR